MIKNEIIVGIDPDIDKSGFALLNGQDGTLVFDSLTFTQLANRFREIATAFGKSVTVVVEASWVTAHNFHTKASDSKAVAAKKGYHVGRNHQAGIDICLLATMYGLNVYEQAPLRKCWKGKDKKITHDEIVQITGIDTKRTNQEERDAILLAWTHAGLPLFNKSIK